MSESTTSPGLERGCDGCGNQPTFRAAVDGGVVRLCSDCRRTVDAALHQETEGVYECPHEDCEEVFNTPRERRGHLGSSEHALDVPEGEFWCGYCGYGPTSWRGVNAHHGSSSHDGDPVRLDEEPSREALLAPEDVPDHKNPELLEELYRRYDGNYSEMCRQHEFEVSPGRVRHYLIEFGIHEVTPQGETEDGDGPVYRDREWLQERYDAADGNVSAMHRQVEADDDVDVPYRTLLKNLKRLGIHDPSESSGRSQPQTQGEDADSAETDAGVDEPDQESEDGDDSEERVVAPDVDTEIVDAVADATGEDSDTVENERSEEEPTTSDDVHAVIDVDDPADVEQFEDLATPDWLAEASFHAALEMSDDAEAFAANLGWGEPADLELMVEALGLEAAFAGGEKA